jgi:hypothetical protein
VLTRGTPVPTPRPKMTEAIIVDRYLFHSTVEVHDHSGPIRLGRLITLVLASVRYEPDGPDLPSQQT